MGFVIQEKLVYVLQCASDLNTVFPYTTLFRSKYSDRCIAVPFAQKLRRKMREWLLTARAFPQLRNKKRARHRPPPNKKIKNYSPLMTSCAIAARLLLTDVLSLPQ